MKKYLSLLLLFVLVIPIRTQAYVRSAAVTVTIVLNTTEGDGLFHLEEKMGDVLQTSVNSFDLQTTNGTITQSFQVGPNVDYSIFQIPPTGWNTGTFQCNSIDPNTIIQTIGTSVKLNGAPYSNIICVYSYSPINKRTPLLIIPGILGTEIFKGSQKLWADIGKMFNDAGDEFMNPLQFKKEGVPLDTSLEIGSVIKQSTSSPEYIFHYDYTKSLIDLLTSPSVGYIENQDLFTFPYDWRYGASSSNLDLLKQKIDGILAQTHAEKLDVIAHSTGGLLLKKYVYDNPNSHTIGKTIFLGVPNLGAPKALKVLLQGDNFGIPFLSDAEMKNLAENFPVTYELSPSQTYENKNGSYVKTVTAQNLGSSNKFLDFNQIDDFLINEHSFNKQELNNAHALHTLEFDNFDVRKNGIDTYSIAGCKSATIGGVTEYRDQKGIVTTINGYSANIISGDGTVPLVSANSIPVSIDHQFYSIKAMHGNMPSQDGIRQEIVNIISGSNLDVGKNIITQSDLISDPKKCQLQGHWWQIFSPVSIEVTDQSGNTAGVVADGSIQNTIPGADYEVIGEHKFVFVPTDEAQTYTVNLKGTGNGTFTFKDETINNGNVANTQVFSNLPVTTNLSGSVNLGATTTLLLDTNGNGIFATITPASIITPDQTLDTTPPTTTSTIQGVAGQPGFYKSNVDITLVAQDPVATGRENETSGILKSQYSLDNTVPQLYSTSTLFTVNSEGVHTIKFFSTDRAGNNEPEQTMTFTIDKTPPELSMQFNPTIKDLQFTASDAVSTGTLSVLDQDDTIIATDQAGNTTKLVLQSKDRKHTLKADIKSLFYNSIPVDLQKSILHFDWLFNKKGELQILTQQIQSKKNFNIFGLYTLGKTIITGKVVTGTINKLVNGLVLFSVSTKQGDLIAQINN